MYPGCNRTHASRLQPCASRRFSTARSGGQGHRGATSSRPRSLPSSCRADRCAPGRTATPTSSRYGTPCNPTRQRLQPHAPRLQGRQGRSTPRRRGRPTARAATAEPQPPPRVRVRVRIRVRVRSKVADPTVRQVQVVLSTEGRPLDAVIELWQGPDNTPCSMRVYVENGQLRPFSAVIETPRGSMDPPSTPPSPPAFMPPPLGASGGAARLGTPGGERPVHGKPSHRLGGSSYPATRLQSCRFRCL